MGNRPWRTIAVGAFAVVLIVQGYFSFATKPEPYPSIRMPNFGTAAAEDGTFDITIAQAEVVNDDGSVEPVSPTKLMEQFRFSAARPSYDYLFRSADPSKITPSVTAWLRDRIEHINHGSSPAELRMCWRRSSIRLADASVIREAPCEWKTVVL